MITDRWRQVDDGTEPDEEWRLGADPPWGWAARWPKVGASLTPARLRELADLIEAREKVIVDDMTCRVCGAQEVRSHLPSRGTDAASVRACVSCGVIDGSGRAT